MIKNETSRAQRFPVEHMICLRHAFFVADFRVYQTLGNHECEFSVFGIFDLNATLISAVSDHLSKSDAVLPSVSQSHSRSLSSHESSLCCYCIFILFDGLLLYYW